MDAIEIDDHPALDAAVFTVELPAPLGSLPSPEEWAARLRTDFAAPLSADDEVRGKVRDLLRHGGYKPTGRGKPASEFLLRAASRGELTSINLAVDACNIASLHSGLPISVIDLDRSRGRLRIGTAGAGSRYAFNPSGQEIDVSGLPCVHDGGGPCANAVRDAQRTKTTADTRRTLSVIWGTKELPGRTVATVRWYVSLLEECGLEVLDGP